MDMATCIFQLLVLLNNYRLAEDSCSAWYAGKHNNYDFRKLRLIVQFIIVITHHIYMVGNMEYINNNNNSTIIYRESSVVEQ